MTTRLLGLLVSAVAAGCSGSKTGTIDASLAAVDDASSPPDAAPPDAAPTPDADLATLSCADLQAFARARVAVLDRSCDEASDCAVLGRFFTCDCTPTLTGESCDVPANAAAAAADTELGRAAELIYQKCHSCSGGVGCWCDCAPSGVSCGNHMCHLQLRSCLDRPDAG